MAYERSIHAFVRGGCTCTATNVSKCFRTLSTYGIRNVMPPSSES
jgi:hypothetical protein